MRLTMRDLKRIIKEECESRMSKDNDRFLHGEDPKDSEGAMAKVRLVAASQMAEDLMSILHDDDQLPGWVQDHITVAHENLRQVHGYLMSVDQK